MTKKIIWWVVGIFFGWSILGAIFMAIAGDFYDGKYPNSFKSGLLALGDGDTLCIKNDTLTLHSSEMTSAKFDVYFKEEMITALKGEELKPSLNGKNWVPVAFLEYQDSLGDCRILLFGKYQLSRDAYRATDAKKLIGLDRRLKEKAYEAEVEAMTSYKTDKKKSYLSFKNLVDEKMAKILVDLPDDITKITLVIGGGDTKRSYDFTPSMGDTYNTLMNFIFGETIYKIK